MNSLDLMEAFIRQNIHKYKAQYPLLRDLAYECLKDAIVSVDVQAGDALSEVRLSNALGISRTPTRTAIQQLAQDGFLQIIPGRAILIASRSIKQVMDALEVRYMLEPEVCRRVAGTLSPSLARLLDECTTGLEKAAAEGDRPAWARIDVQWHEIICNSCPNTLLGQIVLQAKNHMHKQGVSSQVSSDFLVNGTHEHRAIANAIIQGDGQVAYDLMEKHLQHAREQIFAQTL
jgi:DNA-binding GntR family transcriptional regulator